jgi:VanZ family protein
MKRFLSLWLPVILWAAFIYYLSSIPYLRITMAWYDLILRKLAHLFVYAVLARLLARALTGSTFWSWKKIFWSSLALSFLYACSDEYHQTFVPGRVGCLHDVLIDTFAAWVALGLRP